MVSGVSSKGFAPDGDGASHGGSQNAEDRFVGRADLDPVKGRRRRDELAVGRAQPPWEFKNERPLLGIASRDALVVRWTGEQLNGEDAGQRRLAARLPEVEACLRLCFSRACRRRLAGKQGHRNEKNREPHPTSLAAASNVCNGSRRIVAQGWEAGPAADMRNDFRVQETQSLLFSRLGTVRNGSEAAHGRRRPRSPAGRLATRELTTPPRSARTALPRTPAPPPCGGRSGRPRSRAGRRGPGSGR